MSNPDFRTRAKTVLRRAIGAPEPAEEFVHPFHKWVPDAEPVQDYVSEPRHITRAEADARAGRTLSADDISNFKALARIVPPSVEPPRAKFGGNGAGVVTGWGARSEG